MTVLIISGCSRDVENEEYVFGSTEKELCSLSDASKQALTFVQSLGIITRSSNDIGEIKTAYALTKDALLPIVGMRNNWSEVPDTILYVVNLKDDKGYVLVSAIDQNVLGYIEHGAMPEISSITNPGFKLFLHGVIDDARDSRNRDDIDRGGPILEYPYTLDTLYTPMLTTKWGQEEPFNFYCPYVGTVRCPAGCVAVAVGQIVAYHEHPSSYNGTFFNWESIKADSIPTYTPDQLSVAHLMVDIGRIVDMSYSDSVSSASSTNVAKCLDSLGYHHTSLLDYDYNTCMQEFEQSRPVYIKGSKPNSNYGHAWVLDGGLVRSKHAKNFGGDSYTRIDIQRLVHCNWGENGSQDGYFHSDILDRELGVDITRTAYSQNVQIYYEIYPNSN